MIDRIAFVRALFRAVVATLCLVGLGSLPAAASAINLLTPANSTALTPTCNFTGGPGSNCRSQAFVSNADATATTTFLAGNFNGAAPSTQTFTTAFNNWNQANGDLWTLLDGGTLDVTLDVTLAAFANANGGGISNLTVTLRNYNQVADGPTLQQLVWTQALYTNYAPTTPAGSNIVPPAVTLDTYSFSAGSSGSGGAFQAACVPIPDQNPPANNTAPAGIGASPANRAYCDPIYPFQYDNKRLFDGPSGLWPKDSFRAVGLLSTITFLTDNADTIIGRDLTVYDGVSYGFDLKVPEPPTLPVLLLPLAAVWWMGRRKSVRISCERG